MLLITDHSPSVTYASSVVAMLALATDERRDHATSARHHPATRAA
jgi:hypothetical protein